MHYHCAIRMTCLTKNTQTQQTNGALSLSNSNNSSDFLIKLFAVQSNQLVEHAISRSQIESRQTNFEIITIGEIYFRNIFTFSNQFIPIQLAGIQALRNDKSLGENLLKKLQPLQSIQKPHNVYSLRAGRKKTLPVEKLNRDLLTPPPSGYAFTLVCHIHLVCSILLRPVITNKKVTHLFYC